MPSKLDCLKVVARVSAAVAFAALSVQAAAETTFLPEVSAGRSLTDNVRFTGNTPEEDDTYTVFGLTLPVVKTLPDKSFTFLYEGSYRKYDDFDDLDHDEHLVQLSADTTVNRKTRAQYRLDFQDTQSQDYALSGDDAQESLLYYRTERQVIGGSFNVDRELTRNWSGNAAVDFQHIEIDEISGFASGVPADDIGDRRRVGLALGGDRQVSEATSVGFQVGADDFEVDNRPDETIYRVAGRVGTTPSRSVTVGVSIGTAYRDEREDSTVEASANLLKTLRRGRMTVSAGHAVSNAGVVPGGHESTSARAEYVDDAGKRWSWSISARHVDRRADDPGDSDVTNTRGGLSIRFRGGGSRAGFRGVGFKISGYAVSQDSDDPALDSSYTVVSAGIVAYLGRGGS